jgi:pantoate kinase
MPIGCGFGTSGAGALGLSLALNETVGSPLERSEAAQLAHVADVVCRTGLGTVSSVYYGGLTLRIAPGAPGIGRVKTIRLPASARIAAGSFGPISTKRVLSSTRLKSRVNNCSERLLSRINRPHPESSFMRISRIFADCLGLMSHRLEALVQKIDSIGLESSMAMLGETAFCLGSDDDAARIAAIIRRANLTPIISPIAKSGAHLL